jgi:hypothetical protein
MIISHKHKFIFVKTFKTAGSSVEKYLYDYLGPSDILRGSEHDNTPSLNAAPKARHKTAHEIKLKYPNEWNSYFKFSIDRNPWDVAVSWFYWMKHAGRIQDYTFDDWLKQANYDQFKNWNRYTIDNKVVVDKVLKYENLKDEIKTIPIPYNGELETVFVKSGYRKDHHYSDMYNNETSKIIKDNFPEVIKMFEYNFLDNI